MKTEQYPWPEDDGVYKVVQFWVENKAYLDFIRSFKQPAVPNFHSQIVIGFAKSNDIELTGGTNPRFERGQDARIPGGGKFRIEEGKYRFFGESDGYKTRIDLEHLKKVQTDNPDKEMYFYNKPVRGL